MAKVSGIKEIIGQILLKQKYKKQKRVRAISNLDSAQTVGIIFNANSQASYDRASQFANFLMNSKEIQVFAIGYVDDKRMLQFFADKKGFKFFSKRNLNFVGKPQNSSVDFFIDKQFDILIDLSIEDFYPIQYIVALSKAKLKVGRFIEGDNYYDFMIDIKKDNTLDNLINQIELYLSIVNVNTYDK